MKRYYQGNGEGMFESEDGEWVSFEDVENIVRKAIEIARVNNFGTDFKNWLQYSEEEIIEQLKQSKK